MSHRYLRRLADELSAHGDVHSLDLPGFGGTKKPRRALSVEDHARLVGMLLDELGIRDAVLVGHSMGAQFVTEVARTRAEVASAVVLIGPVTDPSRATAFAQGRALARDSLRETPQGNLLTLTDYIRCGPRWYLATLPPMLDYRTDLALAGVAAPTLVLRGENDPVARAPWCTTLADAAPHGELREIPRGRHLVQFSFAPATAAAILDFVREHVRIDPRNEPEAAA
jgi:pimeloyl-ACP methyl ester carboxylesterase